MLDHIEIVCPTCKETFSLPIEFVKQTITQRKFVKVVEVARQLHNKSGPFYERWKAAMESRGEQKRCRDCTGFIDYHSRRGVNYCGYRNHHVNPGQYACGWFMQVWRV